MASLKMDGTEQAIFESTEVGEFSGYVFLNELLAGDTVVLKVYIKDPEDSVYKLWATDSYSGVVAFPALRMEAIIGHVGIKITAKQTAGTYRTITSDWFKR